MNKDKREGNSGQKNKRGCQEKSKKSYFKVLHKDNGENQNKDGNYFYPWVPGMNG